MFKRLEYNHIKSEQNDCILSSCRDIATILEHEKQETWTIYYNDIKYQVPLVNYDIIHNYFGCTELNKLIKRCKLKYIRPLSTLIYHTHYHGYISNDYRCLLRKRDKAMGISVQGKCFYIIPGVVDLDNLSGFVQIF
jgi:hypothetical protein